MTVNRILFSTGQSMTKLLHLHFRVACLSRPFFPIASLPCLICSSLSKSAAFFDLVQMALIALISGIARDIQLFTSASSAR